MYTVRLLFFLLIFPIAAAYAQTPPAPVHASETEKKPAPPAPIAISEIAVQADALGTRLREMQTASANAPAVQAVTSDLRP
ncbi:MAG TPA: hypothetical protein VNT02_03905, partial [Burkholderiales bacterium]|nr:hypothetical protein [Burkholderiales bacterium]